MKYNISCITDFRTDPWSTIRTAKSVMELGSNIRIWSELIKASKIQKVYEKLPRLVGEKNSRSSPNFVL